MEKLSLEPINSGKSLESNDNNENINIPESLKKTWWGPIIILDGGGPWGGAAMAWYLYAYLESGKELPKTIIGSSIGSMIGLYLQDITKTVTPVDSWASEIEKIEYKKLVREAMMEWLWDLFDWDLTSDFELIWVGKSILESFSDNQKKESSASSFFTTPVLWAQPNIFKWNMSHKPAFDLWVATSQDINASDGIGFDPTNRSILSFNDDINADIIDASTAHKGTLWKTIKENVFHDGNYGDYMKELWGLVESGQKIVFLTSYEDVAYDFWKLQEKSAFFSRTNTNDGNLIWSIEERFDLHQTSEIFNKSLVEAREKFYN